MADDIVNALQQANRSASVLQGIANPPQINPLAAITAGNQAAQSEFQTQRDQINTASARMSLLATHAMTIARNPSDANVNAVFDNLGASGMPPDFVARERARWLSMPEAERQNNAERAGMFHLDQLGRVLGTTTIQNTGGQLEGVTAVPPGARTPGYIYSRGSVANTPDPALYYAPLDNPTWLDANGQPTTDPSKAVTQVPRVSPRGPLFNMPAPGGGGGPPGGGAPPASGALPPGAPPPLPGQRIVNGRFVTPPATPPVTSPTTPTTTPPSPTPTPAAPPGRGVVTGLPTGTAQTTEDNLRKDVEAATTARTAMGDQQKRLIAGQSALDALKLADTGPSTGFFARAYAFLKAQGITTVERGALSDTDYRQLLQKNLLRFAQDNGSKAGTDLGLETKLHSNANADEMLAGANRHVLIQDMGILKRDIAQTQEMPEPSATGGVVKHLGSFSANTAPEAFMWNHYTQPERDAIEKEYKDKGQTQKLHDSLSLAVKRGAIPDPRKAAPPPATTTPGKGSFLAPLAPQPNALAMAG